MVPCAMVVPFQNVPCATQLRELRELILLTERLFVAQVMNITLVDESCPEGLQIILYIKTDRLESCPRTLQVGSHAEIVIILVARRH